MTKLVIVESPAKAKTINKYLGNDYKVIASFGHIRNLPSKDGSVRPEEDFAISYEVSARSKKHVKEIESIAKNVEAIYLACDPDREGEAIAWHVVEILKEHKKLKKDAVVKRVVFNEITKDAVTRAINNPRNIDMDLVNAQQARTALDYLVGFTLSPILWRKLPGSKSAGRVQSVALRLICEREEEIEKFITEEYWDIKTDLKTPLGENFTANLTHIENKKLEKFDIPNAEQANSISEILRQKNYSIEKIEKKQIRRNPQPPFTTSSMQQEAHRKLGFTAKKTMTLAQKLYEGIEIDGGQVGLITYMRTDAVVMATEAITSARKYIDSSFGKEYLPNTPRSYKSKAKNAQEAHEAIRPTDFFKAPERIKSYLEKDEYRLYELIWKRALASQMESAVLDVVAATVRTNDGYAHLRANGSIIAFPGFYKLYKESTDNDNESEDDSKLLPPLHEGDQLGLIEVKPEQHFTAPPPRYTEASLVKRMEELGIGRPSTYATIISVIQERNYVRLDKKKFIPEERGRIVTAFLVSYFGQYVQYDFTANLEDKLDYVSAGDLNWKALLREFWENFAENTKTVSTYKNADIMETINQELAFHFFPQSKEGTNNRQCPSCKDGTLSIKASKYGAFIGCSQYPECKYTRRIANEEDGSEEPIETEDRLLGSDPEGLEIYLKKGPYGYYVQKGTDKKDLKRAALPKDISPDSITLSKAASLLQLPRELGKHPESGEIIKANIGRYGPYLQHGKKFVSLKDDNVLTIDLKRALELLNEPSSGKAADSKVIGKHPEDGNDISIMVGRYGPYIKHNKLNAPIPKNIAPEEVNLEIAVEYLKKQKEKKSKK